MPARSYSVHLRLIETNRILKGSLAPGGAVAKITGKEGLHFKGKARVFDTEDQLIKAIETKSLKKGEKTVSLRPDRVSELDANVLSRLSFCVTWDQKAGQVSRDGSV